MNLARVSELEQARCHKCEIGETTFTLLKDDDLAILRKTHGPRRLARYPEFRMHPTIFRKSHNWSCQFAAFARSSSSLATVSLGDSQKPD